ncbi:MAG: RodZ domain-containing protein [Thalassotalea sp.]
MSKIARKPVAEVIAPQELSEDIEVIGPGQMLREGRKAMSMSQEDVAAKLNFRLTLVRDIEEENFDKSLPATFNRGYLRNFAKVVHVSVDDVLASYEMLDVAEKQGAEMQSFSQITKREAENSRLRWLTYFIVALIFGSTLFWFFQEASPHLGANKPVATENTTTLDVIKKSNEPVSKTSVAALSAQPEKTLAGQAIETANDAGENIATSAANANEAVPEASSPITPSQNDSSSIDDTVAAAQDEALSATDKTPVTFYFNGDCWVNIYDATGEHIAWGVKKSGYVMNITGVSPFKVTLGKPELVAINFNGNDIDMKQFNRGNIAKFTLPITVN